MKTSKLSTTDEIPTKGKITFAAYNPKNQLPVTCTPLTDKTGRLYTGQGERGYFEDLTPDQKSKMAYVFDYETKYVLEDGKVLNFEDPHDRAIWAWLRRHPYLSLDKVSGGANRDSVFYVVNAEREADDYVAKTARIDEARPAVRNLSLADKRRIATSLGLAGADTFIENQLLSWLLRKADTDPEAVLNAIDPKNQSKVNASIFFDNIEKYAIIERMRGGIYYFGGEKGISVGHNKDMVVDYLLNPENSERVRAMKAMLAEKTKVPLEKKIDVIDVNSIDAIPANEPENVI